MAMKYKKMREMLSRISPKITHVIMYRKGMGSFPNLRNPRTFNEKVSWLKLYELPKDPLAPIVADKLRVREFVKERGYGELLVPLVGAWENASEISFPELPEQFALKCNHGCGMNIICSDKAKFDAASAKAKLDEWMDTDWALLSAEPHYSKIPRRIICEQYVDGPLVDFKFFCFHGEPKFYYVSEGFDKGLSFARVSFFTMDGRVAPFKRLDHDELQSCPASRPIYFDEMASIAGALSQDFKFARIDFLSNSEGFFFSEVTLTPSAGIMPLEPKEWDYNIGEMLVL